MLFILLNIIQLYMLFLCCCTCLFILLSIFMLLNFVLLYMFVYIAQHHVLLQSTCLFMLIRMFMLLNIMLLYVFIYVNQNVYVAQPNVSLHVYLCYTKCQLMLLQQLCSMFMSLIMIINVVHLHLWCLVCQYTLLHSSECLLLLKVVIISRL